jgi:serine/threonine protein kinase
MLKVSQAATREDGNRAAQTYPLQHPRRGEGAYGVVRGSRRPDGTCVVVKTMIKTANVAADALDVVRETQLLMMLRDLPCVVELLDVYFAASTWNLVYRDAGTDARKLVREQPATMRSQHKRLFAQASAGISAVHDRAIVHADVKTSNLLVDTELWIVRVADFGLSFHEKCIPTKAKFGTKEYAPPEARLAHTLPTRAADCWALGCVLYEFCMAELLYGKQARSDALYIASAVEQVRSVGCAVASRVCATLLVDDPVERVTAAGAACGIGSAEPSPEPSSTHVLAALEHGGSTVLAGHKSPFVFLQGKLENPLTAWLNEALAPL